MRLSGLIRSSVVGCSGHGRHAFGAVVLPMGRTSGREKKSEKQQKAAGKDPGQHTTETRATRALHFPTLSIGCIFLLDPVLRIQEGHGRHHRCMISVAFFTVFFPFFSSFLLSCFPVPSPLDQIPSRLIPSSLLTLPYPRQPPTVKVQPSAAQLSPIMANLFSVPST